MNFLVRGCYNISTCVKNISGMETKVMTVKAKL